jgi:uroporphyrin-III C-methyltransferase
MGSPPNAPASRRPDAGSVFLIGSDPQRPGELSWPALAALAAADAVLHDGAVDPGTLALVPRRVLVEPVPGDIARVGKLAGEGWRVVWLVSGDPARSPAHRADAERLREAGIATHTIAGFLYCDEVAVLGAALPPAGAVAPQPLATALNGLAG